MICGACGKKYSGGMLHRHYTQCKEQGLEPILTINDIKKNNEEHEDE